jgi:hypothetical protein
MHRSSFTDNVPILIRTAVYPRVHLGKSHGRHLFFVGRPRSGVSICDRESPFLDADCGDADCGDADCGVDFRRCFGTSNPAPLQLLRALSWNSCEGIHSLRSLELARQDIHEDSARCDGSGLLGAFACLGPLLLFLLGDRLEHCAPNGEQEPFQSSYTYNQSLAVSLSGPTSFIDPTWQLAAAKHLSAKWELHHLRFVAIAGAPLRSN